MAVIAAKISELYLNEEWSDVRIIIDGEDLPAHRIVLVQRCPFFSNMFKSSFSESHSNRIEIHEMPINGFKMVLKWIYTAEIELNLVSDALDVLRLAHMYELEELMTLVIKHLKKACAVDNVSMILNASVLLSLGELTDYLNDFVSDQPAQFVEHDTFEQLSKDALIVILTDAVSTVLHTHLFRAVVRWMKANPSKSTDFPEILKNVPLQDITLKELIAVPPDVLDANVLVKATAEQYTAGMPCRKLRDQNVALPNYGVKVLAGGETAFFSNPSADNVLLHTIRPCEEGIVVDLGHYFKLNLFKMHLYETDKKNYSYWIDVSEDNVNWTRVIDHSKYACRSLQKLYFNACPVRYIRICGTSHADGIFKIKTFEALYTTEKFRVDPETTLLVPTDNVALVQKHAIILQGFSCGVNSLTDGTFVCNNNDRGYTYQDIGVGLIVQLPQPYMLDCMKLLLYDEDNQLYSYNVEVSVDKIAWTQVFSEDKVASWREVHFDRQPVVFVKLTGTYSLRTRTIRVVHLECYAIKTGGGFLS